MGPTEEYVIFPGATMDDAHLAIDVVYESFRPHKVVVPAFPSEGDDLRVLSTLLKARAAVEDRTTIYRCEGSVCLAPVVGLDAFRKRIEPAPPNASIAATRRVARPVPAWASLWCRRLHIYTTVWFGWRTHGPDCARCWSWPTPRTPIDNIGFISATRWCQTARGMDAPE